MTFQRQMASGTAESKAASDAPMPGKQTLTGALSGEGQVTGAVGASSAGIGAPVAWQSYNLSTNAKSVRAALDDLYVTGGPAAVAQYVGSFRLDVLARQNQKADWALPGAPSAGTAADFEDLPNRQAILGVLVAQEAALDQAVEDYRAKVEQTAWDVAHQMLDDSERTLRAEKARYGLQEEGTNAATGAPIYGMASNADTVGLTSAAAAIAKLTDAIDQAEADKAAASEKKWSTATGGEVTVITNGAAYADAEQRLARGRKDLAVLRPELESKYPILAAFTTEEQLAKLRAGDLSARAMGAEIDDKLANIAKARALFGDGKTRPMGLERVAGLTRTKLAPSGVQAAIFERRRAEAQQQDEPLIPSWLVGVLGAAFAILAAIPATAPIGIVGGAAVADLALPDLIHKYELESEAATLGGTGLGAQALAVAAEDPSLTWLAFEILMAGVAAASAVKVFRQLAISARRVIAPAAPTLLHDSEEALRLEGNELKPGLGDKLVAEATHRKVLTASGDELSVALKPAGTQRPVSPAEIQALYLKGKPGDSSDVDAIATYLQALTARKATELRGYAELAARANGTPLAQVIPGYDGLPTAVKTYLKMPSPATFGTALQMTAEPEMAAAGIKKLYGMIYRKQFRGVPDIQIWPGGGDTKGVIIDWTTPLQAGKAVDKYDWDSVEYIVEIIQPGP